jgi:hypothetical protein
MDTTQHRYTADFVITRDGTEVYRGSWFFGVSVNSQAGFRCDHDVRTSWDFDGDRFPCGSCESQGKNGIWRSVTVVKCPNCDGVYLDDATGGELSFVRHLTDECGQ